jgi:hypothetical protein
MVSKKSTELRRRRPQGPPFPYIRIREGVEETGRQARDVRHLNLPVLLRFPFRTVKIHPPHHQAGASLRKCANGLALLNNYCKKFFNLPVIMYSLKILSSPLPPAFSHQQKGASAGRAAFGLAHRLIWSLFWIYLNFSRSRGQGTPRVLSFRVTGETPNCDQENSGEDKELAALFCQPQNAALWRDEDLVRPIREGSSCETPCKQLDYNVLCA